ncbi:dipeptidase [Sphingosinicella rhizophila]|uniref:Membrane dipeptidase n=1 Tax=Sphingosinicella rhizophila TaxID=3050082 RepID=A0ABU3Q8J4_9SPHN|nr:membrane dipeptidase [Sphingosinicella sp. GR2756]MDT9599724.1 membrane dipeptidase [Sphingosinicella sp. GR2756]
MTDLGQFLKDTLVWDNHGCMPLRPGDTAFLPQLSRYRAANVDVVLLNVGFDAKPMETDIRVLAMFRRWIRDHAEDYRLIGSVADIDRAQAEGKLAIGFNLEGFNALGGDVNMVSLYHDLGVRWMLVAYNLNNQGGGGCQDDDEGLTDFGREVLDEMVRVGIVPCCSHTGYRTAIEVMEHVSGPVILSHSNPRALHDHPRNVPDEVMKACAATGGVMGINGVGIFMGRNRVDADLIADHIDYAVDLIGIDHVGLGIDTCFDPSEVDDLMRERPEIWPDSVGYEDGLQIAGPEEIPNIAAKLLQRGYGEAELAKVLGGNFRRVAAEAWKS